MYLQIKESAGFTMVEVLIALAIVLVIAVGVSSLFLQTQRNQLRLTAGASRAALINSLRFSAQSALALKQTSLTTPALKNCFCGYSTCVENQVVAVQLKDVQGKIISGSPAAPRRYNIEGSPCTNQNCVFEVTSTFECKGAECGTGNFLVGDPTGRIIYRINLLATAHIHKELLSLKNTLTGIPIDFSLKDLRIYSSEICP